MKVINVLELLCENKENFVRKRYSDKILQKYKNNNREETNLPDDTIINGIINNLSSIDPSQKYMEWLTKQYLNDEYILGEDDEQVKQDLKLFTELKNKVEHKDINKYSLSSLRNELNKHLTVLSDDGQFKAQISEAIKKGDVFSFGKQNGIDIYHTITKEGNILLGRGGGHDDINRWCTSRRDSKNRFDYYNEENDIYVFIFGDGKRFQCDVNRSIFRVNNWMNENDNDIVKGFSDQGCWDDMRHTPFMIGIRDKALSLSFERDEYLTTIPEFVKMCLTNDQPLVKHLSKFSGMALYEFEEALPDMLDCLLNIKKDVMFLYAITDFLRFMQNEYVIRTHFIQNSAFDKRFTDRIYDIVENTSKNTNLENLVKTIIKDSPPLDHLYRMGQANNRPPPTEEEMKAREEKRMAYMTRMAKNKEFKNENR